MASTTRASRTNRMPVASELAMWDRPLVVKSKPKPKAKPKPAAKAKPKPKVSAPRAVSLASALPVGMVQSAKRVGTVKLARRRNKYFVEMKLKGYESVEVRPLGQGSFGSAYMTVGEEAPWVYLFVPDDAGDTARTFVLTLAGQRHFPDIRALGRTPKRDAHVFVMPYYHKLPARSVLGKLMARWERRRRQIFDEIVGKDEQFGRSDARKAHKQLLVEMAKDPEVPVSVVKALRALVALVSKSRGLFIIEIPNDNLALDDDGELILLDPVFDPISLDERSSDFEHRYNATRPHVGVWHCPECPWDYAGPEDGLGPILYGDYYV